MKFSLVLLICLTVNTFSQNITNTLGSSGIFTIKDGSTSYLTLSQSTGQVNILKSLRLEYTTSSGLGAIFKGTNRFLHNFGTGNTFLGINSGNFTLTSASYNTGIGNNSLFSLTTGTLNTAVGETSLYSNATGNQNTAIGIQSLYWNTDGDNNIAVGYRSLFFNTSGNSNTAVGDYSLYNNATGFENTAMGIQSMFNNTSGYQNTALGMYSLYNNATGNFNTALGYRSLYSNTTGFENAAVGIQSLYNNTTGNYNTAIGLQSLYNNTTGNYNTALGNRSLNSNITGIENTAVGYFSLNSNNNGFSNTTLGYFSLYANTTGSLNTALGNRAGNTITTGSNLMCLGYNAQPTLVSATNQITLGNNQITSLRCNVTTITALSDARDKKNITDLSLGLDFINKLKPRQFNWDKREWYDDNISDGSKMKESPTAGFIAQELDEVQINANAEWLNLVLKDNPEKWEATPGNLLPIMVKAIQELNSKCDDLETENNELKDKLAKFEQMQNMLALEIEKLRPNETENSTDLTEHSK